MGRKYKKVQAGEWVQPLRKGYRMACCDCGLVHVMNFRMVGRKIQFQAFRDQRATGQIHRRKRKEASDAGQG